MRIIRNILITVLLFLINSNVYAQDLETDSLKKVYIPSGVHLQYAGNIGMLSIGPSWSLLKKRVDVEYSIGYVPKFKANQSLYITAIKGLYKPKLDFKIGEAIIKPLSVGFATSYTFGNRFSKYNNTNQYPKGYYWFTTSLRVGFLYRAEIYTKLNDRKIKGLGFYFETSIWDLDFYSYTDNSNYSDNSNLVLLDLTTFGIGAKMCF